MHLTSILPPGCKASLPATIITASCLGCSFIPPQRGKESWIERMSSTVLCYLVCLSVLLLALHLSVQETSGSGSAAACAAHKHKHSASSCLSGDSANWRSLLWSPVTSWQIEQPGPKLISRVRPSFISVITGCVQREGAKKSRGQLQLRWGQYQGSGIKDMLCGGAWQFIPLFKV